MNAVAGSFPYPPPNSNLQFDYSDTVITSWITNDSYPTEVVLSLWCWLLNGQSNWTISMTAYHPVSPKPSLQSSSDTSGQDGKLTKDPTFSKYDRSRAGKWV